MGSTRVSSGDRIRIFVAADSRPVNLIVARSAHVHKIAFSVIAAFRPADLVMSREFVTMTANCADAHRERSHEFIIRKCVGD